MTDNIAPPVNQHALDRAYERYGLVLDGGDLDALVERVRIREVTVIKNNFHHVHGLCYQCEGEVCGRWCRFVASLLSGIVVTFLPPLMNDRRAKWHEGDKEQQRNKDRESRPLRRNRWRQKGYAND